MDNSAILFVRSDDLDDNLKLKPNVPIEPLILRANAGDWIEITLHNRVDSTKPVFSKVIFKDPGGDPTKNSRAVNMIPFSMPTQLQIPLVTSSSIGLHPSLISYDITTGDGMNVGYNAQQIA